jgi:NADH dehydrogenase (ubiquinone) Fe-S protein 6
MNIPPPEIVRTTSTRVACDGSGAVPAALGHPRVFLHIEDELGYVECGYCDRRFVLEGGAADDVPMAGGMGGDTADKRAGYPADHGLGGPQDSVEPA